jgi:hypothetical protein
MLKVESNLSRIWQWAKRLMASAPGRKRTEITIETDQILIIRRRRVMRAWCPECGGEVEMVGLEEAEAVTRLTRQALSDCAKAPRWHVAESPDGVGLICLESLLKSM